MDSLPVSAHMLMRTRQNCVHCSIRWRPRPDLHATTEVDSLIGDATKAAELLGWRASVHTDELARIMVDADMAALECEGKPWIDKPMIAGRT